MKNVTNRPSFQGDLMIRRIDAMPKGVTKSTPDKNGRHIVAHSETGHHHVIESRAADLFIDATNAFIAYLNVASPTEIEHLRSFDTHGAAPRARNLRSQEPARIHAGRLAQSRRLKPRQSSLPFPPRAPNRAEAVRVPGPAPFDFNNPESLAQYTPNKHRPVPEWLRIPILDD